MRILRLIGKGILTGLAIIIKGALLLPVPLFMLWFNYTVDRSGVFHGDRYNRETALALIEGAVLNEYDRIDERGVYELVAQNIEEPYDTLAFGSSRVLMLRHGAAGGGSYLNCGVSGANLYDMLGIWYQFEKAGMIPKNVILAPDPWVLDPNYPSARSRIEWYNEFLSQSLGMDTGFVPPDPNAALAALISPSYFQGNVEYRFSDRSGEDSPPIITGDAENQPVSVKLGDGSVMYPPAYRFASGAEKRERVTTDINAFIIREGFLKADADLALVFDRYVAHLKELGVNVSILLPPYHPTLYNYAAERRADLEGFFDAERVFRESAAKHGVPVYGSLNPFVDACWDQDFYDGLHAKPETLEKLYPGVQAAAAGQSKPYTAKPYGGVRVTYLTAKRLVAERYEINQPEVLLRGSTEIIGGWQCYVLERYDKNPGGKKDGTPALRLARYAVSQTDGTIYRFDDTSGWTVDLRFPQ